MAEQTFKRQIAQASPSDTEDTVFSIRKMDFFYGQKQALFDINMDVYRKKVTAIIGPSGCGKSTFLRCLNRMNELVTETTVQGDVLLHGTDIYAKEIDPVRLRRRVGMVFQQPNPFPKSIADNVSYGPKMQGLRDKHKLEEVIETSLQRAALWDEVKDRLHASALSLSGGQQQRLCIARAIAVEPEVILMDEPASALDPVATARIEDLIFELKERYTVIIVTHNMSQAARVGDYTAFFLQGDLIEYDETKTIFHKPANEKTEAYIQGQFG